jgi:hypothetical protein
MIVSAKRRQQQIEHSRRPAGERRPNRRFPRIRRNETLGGASNGRKKLQARHNRILRRISPRKAPPQHGKSDDLFAKFIRKRGRCSMFKNGRMNSAREDLENDDIGARQSRKSPKAPFSAPLPDVGPISPSSGAWRPRQPGTDRGRWSPPQQPNNWFPRFQPWVGSAKPAQESAD